MVKKIQLKTHKNDESVLEFINNIPRETLRKESLELLDLFKVVTNMEPKMWGSSIIGFGEYTYYRSNGDEGQYMATGFSPRKSGPTIYVLTGYENYGELLEKLGPYKTGKSCLYLKSIKEIDLNVLKQIIKLGLEDLKKEYTVNY